LVPDPENISHSFPEGLKIAQHQAFSMSEAPYFSESWPLIFDFLTFFITFSVGSGSKSGSAKVPAPQHGKEVM
jgi:hypothetical protein